MPFHSRGYGDRLAGEPRRGGEARPKAKGGRKRGQIFFEAWKERRSDRSLRLRDINDIRKVMGSDLTATGQSEVRRTAVAQSARSEGERVKVMVYGAEQAIQGFRSQITPSS